MSKILYLSCLATIMLAVSCNSDDATDETMSAIPVNLIPLPANMEAKPGVFTLTAETQILVPEEQSLAFVEAEKLGDILRPSTGFEISVNQGEAADGAIHLSLSQDLSSLGEEGYQLTVSSKGVALTAFTPEGLFRGIQTLRQLFPAEIESKDMVTSDWSIPGIDITDQPRFGYRGSMMDVSRHFFSVEDVKRYIDLIAMYKMNVLHLHLTDDQGWRIEIKSWPNLANYGGNTEVGGGEGGFYTQDQYQDIIAYAATKHIMIVPEIDMPGHTNAALASYPELNYEGQAPDLYTGTEVGFSSFTTDREITYKLIDDVVRELSAITPGPYIHIGADEAHSTDKDDFILFVNRVQEIVASHGKSSIGWQEILTSDISPTTVVQYWDTNSEITGFTPETKVLMSPASNTYLDMKYSDTTKLGLQWAGNSDVKDAYEWDPVTLVDKISNSDIIGVEAPIWAETTEDMSDIEYLVFPRLPGIAEIGWSPVDGRSWDEYKYRLASQGDRFKVLGINYYASPMVPWGE